MAREARIKEVIIPEGNTFSLDIAYQRDGDNSLLPEGCDLLAAFYDYMGQLLKECRLSEGTIVKNQNGTYTLSVSHEDSMRMHRKVTVEVTVVNSSTGSVIHAVETVDLIFIPKNNNKIL